MPTGNGELALSVFPVVMAAGGATPKHPHNCTTPLLAGRYCSLGEAIAVHDTSCQITDTGGGVEWPCGGPAACLTAAAAACAKIYGCGSFSSLVKGGAFQLFVRTCPTALRPYPDADWFYYADTKPWPDPAPLPAAGNFSLDRVNGSVSFLVNMATAMASDTSLFKLGMVSLTTFPSLFGRPDDALTFRQSLNLTTATVSISLATTGLQATVEVYVDANSNLVVASVRTSRPVQLTVTVQSVHPSQRFAYAGGFGGGTPSSAPDVFEESPPLPDSVVVSHRNVDNDFPKAFNYSLEQQGLAALVPQLQGSDRWRHRQFGIIASGGGLHRVSASVLTSSAPAATFTVLVTAHANQTATHGEWMRQLHALHVGRRSNAMLAKEHAAWWQAFWGRSHITVSSVIASAATQRLTEQYAVTRYLQAIQTRTWVPIKFNGQLFTTNLPPETATGGPEKRDWGANSWWQNTRLTYWNMASAGDFDTFATILEFYLQTLPFNEARTLAYFNHTGIFYTETKTLFGAFAPSDYGANASQRGPHNLPRCAHVWFVPIMGA